MIVLGIETSCDETGVGIVKDGKVVLANIVVSSLKIHSKYGGVIPEIASRLQLESVTGVYCAAIKAAKIKAEEIDLVAVTTGPGLPGSLLVGVSFAKALALSLGKPILSVNHVYSHIYANILCYRNIKLPCVALVVSGGHTSLFYVKDFFNIQVLGQTQDDACGEAFDKVAKIMGLGYPGGPLIEKLSRDGNKHKIKFSCSGTRGELDFSFSGIKTAVLYYLKDNPMKIKSRNANLAASFQESVVNVLIKKSLLACKRKNAKQLLIGGGVAANSCLRQKLISAAKDEGINCFFPSIGLCMDNAAMVSGLAYFLYKRGVRDSLYLNIQLNN
ncbi:MAG: tRNA (adenosine(37)-N6)-threonylcarbamoyltransferase complex transferase subunit TsaD [Candidatus Omnitrophica bacterium]|nr:tRNA (adenosine(37)-N6)-threonylcarbamoyltransferase complex transferase subunit TsaD [Candidatus Omnitrophota bacterium]MBU1922704.1 tRNA (adenosine(37)-N6)-threonylcarbamoyltransferase complex transferase subunit TsaD [Candidatus Omnitrophota bacterium]